MFSLHLGCSFQKLSQGLFGLVEVLRREEPLATGELSPERFRPAWVDVNRRASLGCVNAFVEARRPALHRGYACLLRGTHGSKADGAVRVGVPVRRNHHASTRLRPLVLLERPKREARSIYAQHEGGLGKICPLMSSSTPCVCWKNIRRGCAGTHQANICCVRARTSPATPPRPHCLPRHE